MVTKATVRADAKGRLMVPGLIRKELGIEAGDVFFLEVADGVLHFAKAVNPLDVLAEHAIAEYEAGRTRSLREFAAESAISLDDDSHYNGTR